MYLALLAFARKMCTPLAAVSRTNTTSLYRSVRRDWGGEYARRSAVMVTCLCLRRLYRWRSQ